MRFAVQIFVALSLFFSTNVFAAPGMSADQLFASGADQYNNAVRAYNDGRINEARSVAIEAAQFFTQAAIIYQRDGQTYSRDAALDGAKDAFKVVDCSYGGCVGGKKYQQEEASQ